MSDGKKAKILLIDDNIDFLMLIQDFIREYPDMEVIDTAKDGEEGLSKAIQIKPDIMIIDLVMPKLDGIGMLERMKELQSKSDIWNGKKPVIIALTAMGLESIVRRTLDAGADYYIVKPFNMDSLIKNIRELVGRSDVKKAFVDTHVSILDDEYQKEVWVTEALNELGVPSNIIGYNFLREAILISLNHGKLINSITKNIYPIIAKNNNTTSSRVERAIRHAIELVWSKGDINCINRIFGNTVDAEKGKPTNSAFIARMSDSIRLNMAKS